MSRRNPWAVWLEENGPGRYQLSSRRGWDRFVHRGQRAPLELLTRRQMAGLTATDLEDYNEARLVWNANLPTVKTHQLEAAFDVFDQVLASNRRDADRQRATIVLDASPGLGKTTVITRYARDFHRRIERRSGPKTRDGNVRLPVAFVPLTGSITLKGLNQKLLGFYGHPAAERTTSRSLESLAVDCVTSCDTQLVVLDDVHFVNFGDREGRAFSNHVKGWANEMPATFCFSGVRLRDKRFFSEGLLGDTELTQTSSRAVPCTLAPFATDTDAGHRAWHELLDALERHILLADHPRGLLREQADELYRRSQGRIGSLTGLLDRACLRAIKDGAEAITAQVLSQTASDNASHPAPAQPPRRPPASRAPSPGRDPGRPTRPAAASSRPAAG